MPVHPGGRRVGPMSRNLAPVATAPGPWFDPRGSGIAAPTRRRPARRSPPRRPAPATRSVPTPSRDAPSADPIKAAPTISSTCSDVATTLSAERGRRGARRDRAGRPLDQLPAGARARNPGRARLRCSSPVRDRFGEPEQHDRRGGAFDKPRQVAAVCDRHGNVLVPIGSVFMMKSHHHARHDHADRRPTMARRPPCIGLGADAPSSCRRVITDQPP